MRVRPFFWGFFALVCTGLLVWAAIVPRQAPARLLIHLMRSPTPALPTIVLVEATDLQGITIDDAQLASQAWMTNMPMSTRPLSTTARGQGTYLVLVRLPMAGPWLITISLQAHGFTPLRQTLQVQVPPDSPSCPVEREILQTGC